MYTQLGAGDEATWLRCTGHPHDPRTVDAGDYLTPDDALDEAADECMRNAQTVQCELELMLRDDPNADRQWSNAELHAFRVELMDEQGQDMDGNWLDEDDGWRDAA